MGKIKRSEMCPVCQNEYDYIMPPPTSSSIARDAAEGIDIRYKHGGLILSNKAVRLAIIIPIIQSAIDADRLSDQSRLPNLQKALEDMKGDQIYDMDKFILDLSNSTFTSVEGSRDQFEQDLTEGVKNAFRNQIPINADRRESPPIICLCGSTKFKDLFEQKNKAFTLDGNIVLTAGIFVHTNSESITTEEKQKLDNLHKRKIDLADMIYVINLKGYIGDSTRSEIEYAKSKNKGIMYMEEPRDEKQ